MDDIVDTHRKYLETYPENPIGKSIGWRPLWVIPVQKQFQDVHKCIYNETIDLIYQALTNKAKKDKIQLNFKVSTADDIWQLTVIFTMRTVCGGDVLSAKQVISSYFLFKKLIQKASTISERML